MKKKNGRRDREKFMQIMDMSMKLMGFNAEIDRNPEYPISIVSKLIGYEDLPIDFVGIFMPIDEATAKEAEIFQLYFSLYDKDVDEATMEKLKPIFNSFNVNCPIGTFGVQDDIFKVCYKQGLVLPNQLDDDEAVKIAMQSMVMMALSLDKFYDKILSTIEN